jgi:hypothetical protein
MLMSKLNKNRQRLRYDNNSQNKVRGFWTQSTPVNPTAPPVNHKAPLSITNQPLY